MDAFTYYLGDDFFDPNETENTTVLINTIKLPCEMEMVDPTAALIMFFFLLIICTLAIPGNFLVGLVIITSRQALTSSDVYLFHLTVADGLMALTLPFFALALVRGWIFGDFLCKLVNLVIETNFYTSIIFLACISVDRYIVIVRATEGLRNGRRRCSRLLCASVWGIGLALALPALFHAIKAKNDSKEFVCTETFDIGSPTVWRLATRGLQHIFGFVIPFIVMLACYSVTIAKLLHTRGFQKHKAMRVITAVVIAFFLCWTPYHVTLMLNTLLRAKLINYDCAMKKSIWLAEVVTNGLALSHSCINPFLYAFVGKKFRKKVTDFIRKNLRTERMSASRFSRSTSVASEGSATFL